MRKTLAFNRIVSVVLVIALSLSLGATALAGFDNFATKSTMYEDQFTDVNASNWFYESVRTAYEAGIVSGMTDTTFAPDDNLTIAQALKMAAVIHSRYTSGTADFEQATPWYQVYVDYATTNEILKTPFADYNATITRAQFAEIFASTLPEEALGALAGNEVPSGSIPDVGFLHAHATAIYKLYLAGILGGSDDIGTFNPDSNIKRSEVAAIVTRMINPEVRIAVKLASAPVEESTVNKANSDAAKNLDDKLRSMDFPGFPNFTKAFNMDAVVHLDAEDYELDSVVYKVVTHFYKSSSGTKSDDASALKDTIVRKLYDLGYVGGPAYFEDGTIVTAYFFTYNGEEYQVVIGTQEQSPPLTGWLVFVHIMSTPISE